MVISCVFYFIIFFIVQYYCIIRVTDFYFFPECDGTNRTRGTEKALQRSETRNIGPSKLQMKGNSNQIILQQARFWDIECFIIGDIRFWPSKSSKSMVYGLSSLLGLNVALKCRCVKCYLICLALVTCQHDVTSCQLNSSSLLFFEAVRL